MSIIEQNGGYDKAKKFCEYRISRRKTFVLDGLEEALYYYEMGFNSNGSSNFDHVKINAENQILKADNEKLTEMLFSANDSELYLYTELGIADRKIKLAIDYITQFQSENEALCGELLSILSKGGNPNQETIDAINSEELFDFNITDELEKIKNDN